MKKLFALSVFQVIMFYTTNSQPVTDYLYKLDNGITFKTEHTWSHVWVQQNYAPLAAGDLTPLAVNIRALGDLISGSTYNLLNKGKDIKMKGAAPGNYDLKLTFKLSGKPGNLSFVVRNVLIKPKTKTNISVTLYDYQIILDESSAASTSLSSFETFVQRCKISTVQDNLYGVPTFYVKGNRDKTIIPDEINSKTKGKIKPGTYDLLLSITISGQNQSIWLENFQMKPGINYRVSANLNAGGIIYTGGNKSIKAMHLYPAGTAVTQTGAPTPIKNQETISYNNIGILNCCSPGSFDILLRIGNGEKYEWRKNIAVTTGSKTEVK